MLNVWTPDEESALRKRRRIRTVIDWIIVLTVVGLGILAFFLFLPKH